MLSLAINLFNIICLIAIFIFLGISIIIQYEILTKIFIHNLLANIPYQLRYFFYSLPIIRMGVVALQFLFSGDSLTGCVGLVMTLIVTFGCYHIEKITTNSKK